MKTYGMDPGSYVGKSAVRQRCRCYILEYDAGLKTKAVLLLGSVYRPHFKCTSNLSLSLSI